VWKGSPNDKTIRDFRIVAPDCSALWPRQKPATLRELLLAELRTTHDKADWFVPANTAMKGLTAERANWSDGKGNHSVGQLAHHLVFWNRWSLERLKGSTGKYTGTNDETFYKFDAKTCNDTVRELGEGMNEIEKWVETADEAKLKESAQTVNLICTHNAYYIGQIIYLRCEKGSWAPNMGRQITITGKPGETRGHTERGPLGRPTFTTDFTWARTLLIGN
jgi:hypothetical protein